MHMPSHRWMVLLLSFPSLLPLSLLPFIFPSFPSSLPFSLSFPFYPSLPTQKLSSSLSTVSSFPLFLPPFFPSVPSSLFPSLSSSLVFSLPLSLHKSSHPLYPLSHSSYPTLLSIQVFGLLKGKPTWLTPYLDPPLPLLVHSVLARDIIGSLEKATGLAAEWLLRAGTSPTLKDWAGYTPLHLAAISGEGCSMSCQPMKTLYQCTTKYHINTTHSHSVYSVINNIL